jgi:hypothetical protein
MRSSPTGRFVQGFLLSHVYRTSATGASGHRDGLGSPPSLHSPGPAGPMLPALPQRAYALGVVFWAWVCLAGAFLPGQAPRIRQYRPLAAKEARGPPENEFSRLCR